MTVCIVVVLLGVAALILGLIPPTRGYVGGVGPGIALVVVGIVLAVILRVTGTA